MEYVGVDNWERPVYKCTENGSLWKDITLGSEKPELYSCGNEFDGEPSSPIKSNLDVTFKTKKPDESPYRFNYMMLAKMQSDCDYYLVWGNRNNSRLWDGSVLSHISEMKRIYDSFPCDQKPEWLSLDGILEYEKKMLNSDD